MFSPKWAHAWRGVARVGAAALQSRGVQGRVLDTAVKQRKRIAIFNRKAKELQRNRAATLPLTELKLFEVVGNIAMERLQYVQREFPVVLELGCHRGVFSHKYLSSNPPGLKKYIQCDLSQDMLDSCRERTLEALPPGVELVQLRLDEEGALPFDRRSVDLAVSNLALHWVNDIESSVRQLRTVLKQDGVLFFSVFGGKTLQELQSCFTVAEQERDGGVSPHVNPFLTGPSVGDLLTNAGYNFPTVDIDRFTFWWETPFHLMEFLQMIGESNCLVGRRRYVPRDTMLAMAAIYSHLWEEDGKVPATFEVINGIGWSPHPSHAQPSVRGSGTVSLKQLAEALGEEVMEEEVEGPLTEEQKADRRERLANLLSERGVHKERLEKLAELVKRKADGDDSYQLQDDIANLKRTIQAPQRNELQEEPRSRETLGDQEARLRIEAMSPGKRGEDARKALQEIDRKKGRPERDGQKLAGAVNVDELEPHPTYKQFLRQAKIEVKTKPPKGPSQRPPSVD